MRHLFSFRNRRVKSYEYLPAKLMNICALRNSCPFSSALILERLKKVTSHRYTCNRYNDSNQSQRYVTLFYEVFMNKIIYKRKPTLPGVILSEEFLKPLQITQKQLATHLEVDIKVINRLINGRTSLSAEMALKLSTTFQTSADFWLSAQYEIDLFEARKSLTRLPAPLIKLSFFHTLPLFALAPPNYAIISSYEDDHFTHSFRS